jgi:heme exporter protein D
MSLDFDMSPYAGYVWAAWGASALGIVALAAAAVAGARRWGRALAEAEAQATPEDAA